MLLKIKDSNYKLYQFTILSLILTAIGCIFIISRIYYKGNLRYAFLIWNIFLAWIPFYFSILFTQINWKNKLIKFIVAILWLLFYPNSCYMITDFIHLSSYNFYTPNKDYFAFNSNFLIWYDFFLISILIIIGVILSFTSLKLMHDWIKKKVNQLGGWIFVVVVCILSGYAIYLGRFIRVNSWEVITNPLYLINVLIGNINYYGLIFSLLFGSLSLFIYISFYITNKYFAKYSDF